MPPEIRRPLFERHVHLELANRHHALGQRHVILHDQPDSNHNVIDVMENQRIVGRVGFLALEEGHGVFAPVTQGVEVVRSMVAVIVAVAVGLLCLSVSGT